MAALLTEREVAAMLGIHLRTLKRWRAEEGMPHILLAPGGRQCPAVRYEPEALRVWLAARTVAAPVAPGPIASPTVRRGRPRRQVPAGGVPGDR